MELKQSTFIELAISLIGSKWKGILLNILNEGTWRFGELERLIPEITPKMLTQKLRELESDRLIVRTEYSEVPRKVEYSISEYGKTLKPILNLMAEWGYAYSQDKPMNTSRVSLSPQRQSGEQMLFDKRILDMIKGITFDAIVIHKEGKILEVDEAFVKLFGYHSSKIVGKNVWEFVSGLQNGGQHHLFLSTLKKQPIEVKGIRKEGIDFPIEVVGQTINCNGLQAEIIFIRDLTEQEKYEKKLDYLTFHDHLTNLPNRLALQRQLTLAITNAHRKNKMLAVICLNLNRFKKVNFTLGSAVGDHLLKAVAQRLETEMRKTLLSYRTGDDEFTLVLPDITNEKEVIKVADKITKIYEEPFDVQGYELNTSVNIGISLYPQDGDNGEMLNRNANIAMYEAKKQRSSYQFYKPEMNHLMLNLWTLENELRYALERNQLILHYQPILDMNNGRVIGMETLVRWNHHELGLISPTEFIPIAENTGLILPISKWVLRTSCAQNKYWQEAGYPPIRVSVNLSITQFQHKSFLDTVKEILYETNLDPKYLDLEITENIFMTNIEYANNVLQELKDLGVSVSIDDFGTGYCSLDYLKTLPIGKLKIDHKFIKDIDKDKKNKAIVKSMISMAHSLRLKVISEGVETENQLRFLRNEKCDEMQGFLFREPLPTNDFEKLLLSKDKLIIS